jgi:hypothetical protein
VYLLKLLFLAWCHRERERRRKSRKNVRIKQAYMTTFLQWKGSDSNQMWFFFQTYQIKFKIFNPAISRVELNSQFNKSFRNFFFIQEENKISSDFFCRSVGKRVKADLWKDFLFIFMLAHDWERANVWLKFIGFCQI